MNTKHLLKLAKEVMPLDKWEYCHENLKKQDVYCDWVFEMFLYELIYLSRLNFLYENLIKFNHLDEHEKQKLVKIIKSNTL